jgi:hypothetical protein
MTNYETDPNGPIWGFPMAKTIFGYDESGVKMEFIQFPMTSVVLECSTGTILSPTRVPKSMKKMFWWHVATRIGGLTVWPPIAVCNSKGWKCDYRI